MDLVVTSEVGRPQVLCLEYSSIENLLTDIEHAVRTYLKKVKAYDKKHAAWMKSFSMAVKRKSIRGDEKKERERDEKYIEVSKLRPVYPDPRHKFNGFTVNLDIFVDRRVYVKPCVKTLKGWWDSKTAVR